MPDEVIGTDAVRVDNPILLDNLTSTVVREEHEIKSTDQNIPMKLNCTNEKLHVAMPACCENSDDQGDKIDDRHAISTTILRQQAATNSKWFDLVTSDVNGNEGDDGDDADADEEEEASQTNNGLTHTLED
jgi:hypothetical protein